MLGKSIRRFVMIYTCTLLLIISAGYSLVAFWFMSKGMDSAELWQLEKISIGYAAQYQSSSSTPLPNTEHITATLAFETLPDFVRRHFPVTEHQNKTLLYHEEAERVYFLFPYDLHDGKRLYLLSQYDQNDLNEATEFFVLQTINTLWPVMAISVALAMLAVIYMTHQLIKPIRKLERWATQLKLDDLHQPPNQFTYQELNAVAAELYHALQRIRGMLTREQQFLRNASHELRTPISVVTSNITLLKHIRKATPFPEKTEQPIARIERAGQTMRDLTETLLWLSRERPDPVEPHSVAIDELIQEIVNDNQYLLLNKTVKLQLQLTPTRIEIAPTPCRIAISNLIRNAMQYTEQGFISIKVETVPVAGDLSRVQDVRVQICNSNQGDMDITSAADYGYGLGLALVDQISARMGWQHHTENISGGRLVEIQFPAKYDS
ncbi:MAG: HAMP domain-containing histidine kinase [Pseudomonadales bacterium]|nr:HAMP domain-containing histidine kinase [Pseudomonadales bacterium]